MPEQKRKQVVPSIGLRRTASQRPSLRLQWPRTSSAKRLLAAKGRLQNILQLLWKEYRQPAAEVEVNFVDEVTICRLHQEFFDDASPTDIITFDLGLAPDATRRAALCICVEAALGHAARYRISPEVEIQRLVIHGVLHLLGYDDQSPAQRRRMRRRERQVMALVANKE
ncbi:MAG: rRNA maturation RNase YbeY [bacterium]